MVIQRVKKLMKAVLKMVARAFPPIGMLGVFLLRFREGSLIFDRIMSPFGDESVMLLCPYPGTGDVYLASLFISEFVRRNNITCEVVVVIGKANEKVASLFGFERIVVISEVQANRLVRYHTFLGKPNERMIIMHHHPPQNHCGILEMMRNHNGLHFADLFLYGVFRLSFSDRQQPDFAAGQVEAENILRDLALKQRETVILAPYVNTLSSLPWSVWEEVADRLRQKGYVVCTNCGSSFEEAVKGTIPIQASFLAMVPLMEKCGHLIAMRSGFCDVVSSARCKKIILYATNFCWNNGTEYDYFSLNRIGMCTDAIEISCIGEAYPKVVEQIMVNF